MAERARSRRRRTRRRRAVAAAVGVAVIAGGSAAGFAATNGTGPARRLGTVQVGSVTQTVESSGTVISSLKLTPSFPTSGTVKSVDVKVGDTVKKGETLAQLDTTSLQASVDSANSTLANAEQRLEADKTGQTSVGSTSSSSLSSTSSPVSNIVAAVDIVAAVSGPPSSTSSGNSDLIKQVEAAQNAVISAQQHVDAAQSAVDTAQKTVDSDVEQNVKLRDAQHDACAGSTGGGGSPTPDPSSSSASSSVPTVSDECASAMAAYEASADTLSSDMATLDAKISMQDGDLKDLDSAITTLDRLVDQLQQAAAKTGSGSGTGSGGRGNTGGSPSGPGQGGSPSGQKPSNPTGSGQPGSGQTGQSRPGNSTSGQPGSGQNGAGQNGSGQNGAGQNGAGQTSQPASAAQLAADQAAIDAAEAQLKVAEQDLAAATLTSPAAGKVAAVGFTAGSSSSGATITIVGTGIPGVDISVPLAQVDQVKVGQPVTVSADGVSTKLHGTVRSIGLLSSTSGSRTTFPVTVQLDAGTPKLYDGSGADAVITTGTARNVITVPNTAIHSTVGGIHTATVVKDGKTSTVRVTLGLAGPDISQVKSGLQKGQQVVLADLSEPLPSSTTSGSTGTFRFPGGGSIGFPGGRVNR